MKNTTKDESMWCSRGARATRVVVTLGVLQGSLITPHAFPNIYNNRSSVASSFKLDMNSLEKWSFQNLVNFNAAIVAKFLGSEDKHFQDILFGSNTLKM